MARTKQTARKAYVPPANLPKEDRRGVKKKKRERDERVKRVVESSQQLSQQIINTQQFSLRFDDQQKCQASCVTDKVFRCKECSAILTAQSEVLDKKSYLKVKSNPSLSDQKKQKLLNQFENVWICEFCSVHNSIGQYYPPKNQNPCFLIEKNKSNKNKKVQSADKNRALVFCIDISTSMDTKPPLNTKSRLESVKEAISQEISRMKYDKQNIQIGLVTFGSYVRLESNGKKFKQYQIDPSHYHNFNQIVQVANSVKQFLQPLDQIFIDFKKMVQNLATYGSTALGPGLIAAIELASKGTVGSKVILCTDGQANVGIGGSFHPGKNTFYEQLGQFAKKKKVMVNILSLKGDRCNLKQLGKLSLATGGCVLKIDPANLGTQFSKITQEEVLGSNSQIIIKLNKIFNFKNADPKQLSKDGTTCVKDFGNFTQQTQLTFQFTVLTKEQALKNNVDSQLFVKSKVPMQIQLTYIGRDGSKFLQVVTDWRELTMDEGDIYEGANFGLFAACILQRASKKIKEKQFKEAQSIVDGYWSIVEEKFKNTESKQQLQKFSNRVTKIQKVLQSKMIKAGLITVVKGDNPGKLNQKKQVKAKRRTSSRTKTKRKTKKSQQDSQSSPQSISRSRSREKNKPLPDNLRMESDQEEQCIFMQMRARSRSLSPEQKMKKRKK